MSLGLSSAMFSLGCRCMPYRRVGVGPALAGGIVAAILWEIAKQLFGLYIRQVGVYDQIYGPFAALVAFIMFVYYSAVVFVVGAAYVAALDARRRRSWRGPGWPLPTSPLSRPPQAGPL